MRLIAVAVLALVMAACSSAPVSRYMARPVPVDRLLAYQQPPVGPSAKVMLIRDSGIAGSACYHAVHINDTLAARIDTSESATFVVEPGKVRVRVGRDPYGKGPCGSDNGMFAAQVVALEAGQVQVLRISTSAMAALSLVRVEE